jgi:hypothetical protein
MKYFTKQNDIANYYHYTLKTENGTFELRHGTAASRTTSAMEKG